MWIVLNNLASTLNSIYGSEGPVFIDGLVNLIEVLIHSKTNFVIVAKISCCSSNDRCCARTDIARSSNNLFALDSTQYVNRSCCLVEKILETRLWHRDRWWIVDLQWMSSKLYSSRLYECFKLSQIPRKLLAHESLQVSDRLFFFYGKTGHVEIVPLEQRRTFSSEWYTTICLPVVFKNSGKATGKDNASFHTLAQTIAFLSTQSIDLRSPATYSSDLALNDFFWFPWEVNIFQHLKKRLMLGQLAQTHSNVCRT